MTRLTREDSARLLLLRFPLILLVLFIHSFIAPVNYASGSVPLATPLALTVLVTALSDGVARVAVPLLFLIAAYLFFHDFDGTPASYGRKIRSRIGTLLVPYLFWNCLVATLFIVGQTLPRTAPFFNAGPHLLDGGVLGIADAVLGITRDPIAYPFWFVRDLMVLSLCALPLHRLLARTGWLLPALCALGWLANLPFLPVPSIEATTWFTIGAVLAMRKVSLFAWERHLGLLAPLYLLALAADVTLRVGSGIWWLYPATIALGVAATLCFPRLALRVPRFSAALATLASASFFVFAAHEPLMTLVRKLLYRLLTSTSGVVLCVYLLEPLLVAAVTAATYFALRRTAPRLVEVIGGNRTARQL